MGVDGNILYRGVFRGKTIIVREPMSPSEYRGLMDVQLEIWGMPDYSEAVTYHLLLSSHRNGGIVLGAYEEESGRPVGIVYSIPGYRDGMIYMYSHLTGVVPEYRYSGLGYMLKKLQRRIALEKGYSLITWTFDPLQSSNAYFNLVKLGVVIRRFYPNYYGELMDNINRGLPGDRFIAEWWIRSSRVSSIVEHDRFNKISYDKVIEYKPFIAMDVEIVDDILVLKNYRLDSSSDLVIVEIPCDINRLKNRGREYLGKWVEGLRTVFNYYLNKMGYIVIGFTSHMVDGFRRSYYILWRRSLDEILCGSYPWS